MRTVLDEIGIKSNRLGGPMTVNELHFGDPVLVATPAMLASAIVVGPKRTTGRTAFVTVRTPFYLPYEIDDHATLIFRVDPAAPPRVRKERREQRSLRAILGRRPEDPLPRRLGEILGSDMGSGSGFDISHEGRRVLVGSWDGFQVNVRTLDHIEIVSRAGGTVETIGHLDGGGYCSPDRGRLLPARHSLSIAGMRSRSGLGY